MILIPICFAAFILLVLELQRREASPAIIDWNTTTMLAKFGRACARFFGFYVDEPIVNEVAPDAVPYTELEPIAAKPARVRKPAVKKAPSKSAGTKKVAAKKAPARKKATRKS